ncbi:hypothetical protein NX801_13855 [Streptomyces sp. LP05-1]|uniref:Uncharacterized protein n=1 Tax=Streptomyces pyxinae TaxID=2970734 RepID=A0ABT2CH37_9ACTN|nr:hypothetical protein [Streptomyces sp. LP05-1]MCS0636725.1 hypothetical protein [Streptomyces sp. LP05-1]
MSSTSHTPPASPVSPTPEAPATPPDSPTAFEAELAEMLRRVGGTFDGDQSALVAGGVARGRRSVRRRRAATAAAGAAVLSLLGTGAWAGGLLGGGSEVARRTDHVDGGRIHEIWRQLTPAGTFSQQRELPRGAGEYAHVSFVYDDGKGAGLVEFRMGRADAHRSASGCERTDPRCRVRTLPDGGRTRTVESARAPYTTLATKSVRSELITADGHFVEATVWNAPDPARATGTRKAPVLMYEMDRLNAPAWRQELARFRLGDPLAGEPALDPAFLSPSGKFSGERLATLLAGMLPEPGHTVERARGTTDPLGPSVALRYDDGRGAAQVTAELYRVDPQGFSARQAVSCRGIPDCAPATRPDGGRLRVDQSQQRKAGTVRRAWAATYLSGRGDLVRITERNAASEAGPATRELPPLTTERLAALATSPQWRPALDELPAAPRETLYGPTAGGARLEMIRSAQAAVRLHARDAKKFAAPDCDGPCVYRTVWNQDGLGPGAVEVYLGPERTNRSAEPRLTVRQEPVKGGGDRTVRWVFTGARPGGREVTVVAYNAPRADADATRVGPPMNVPLLKALAMDPGWNAPDIDGAKPAAPGRSPQGR